MTTMTQTHAEPAEITEWAVSIILSHALNNAVKLPLHRQIELCQAMARFRALLETSKDSIPTPQDFRYVALTALRDIGRQPQGVQGELLSAIKEEAHQKDIINAIEERDDLLGRLIRNEMWFEVERQKEEERRNPSIITA